MDAPRSSGDPAAPLLAVEAPLARGSAEDPSRLHVRLGQGRGLRIVRLWKDKLFFMKIDLKVYQFWWYPSTSQSH